MQDTKNNNIKETSFAEQLQHAKGQDLTEREEADRLFTQLKKDVEINWKECFEKCIQDGYIEVKNNIMSQVKAGNILKHKDKNIVYVRYNFKEMIDIPREFCQKVNEALNKISNLWKKNKYEIVKQIPEIHNSYLGEYKNIYKMCNPKVEGLVLVGLNDNCVRFAEELEKRLLNDGIKLEGIVSSKGGRVCFKKIRGKTLWCLVESEYDSDEGTSYKLALKFSMEF